MYLCMYNCTYVQSIIVAYRILQIVRGGKVSRMDKVLQIRWKTSRFVHPSHKNVLTCVQDFINRTHLLNNSELLYVPLILSLSDLGRYSYRQCGCKIVSSWKSHNVA